MSRDISLDLIQPDPEQPRKHFDEALITELAQSIKENGLAVPILVRPNGDGFIIVHGERRWRAFQHLGYETIPAEVRDIDADEASWLALVENIQRSDLTPIEEAEAYRTRLDQGMTQTELARRIGKTQTYIAHKLRLLKLPTAIESAISERKMTEGHARQLLRLKDEPQQIKIFKAAMDQEWSVKTLSHNVDILLALETHEQAIEDRWTLWDEEVDKVEREYLESIGYDYDNVPLELLSVMPAPSEVMQTCIDELGFDSVYSELITHIYTLRRYRPRGAYLAKRLAKAEDLAVTDAPAALKEFVSLSKTAGRIANNLMASKLRIDHRLGEMLNQLKDYTHLLDSETRQKLGLR